MLALRRRPRSRSSLMRFPGSQSSPPGPPSSLGRAHALLFERRSIPGRVHELLFEGRSIPRHAHALLFEGRSIPRHAHALPFEGRSIPRHAHALPGLVIELLWLAIELPGRVHALLVPALAIAWPLSRSRPGARSYGSSGGDVPWRTARPSSRSAGDRSRASDCRSPRTGTRPSRRPRAPAGVDLERPARRRRGRYTGLG